MSRFLIINTGGTIGMAVGPNGLEPKAGLLRDTLEQHPRLAGWREHSLDWDEWQPLLDSSDIRPHQWYQLRDRILASDADAVLVVHGTDTLAHSAAALSFLLSGTGRTVVLTGAMRSLMDSDSDGFANLETALSILENRSGEVFVAFGGEGHARCLPGSRITKRIDHDDDDALAAPGWHDDGFDQPSGQAAQMPQRPWRPAAIGLITLFPGMPLDGLMSMIERNYRALVLNAYANGNAMNDGDLKRILLRAQDKGIPVFVRSQVFDGKVNIGQYAASGMMAEVGAIGCGQMPLEAVLTKLQILACEHDSGAEIARAFVEPWAREWQS
ncbi:asparaginase [Saccharospirillum mangrovi]|uniref:asparaginase n=1 Tax=Saccharospirillum mangrovi TaxID=2161747 RepID=UPI000D3B3344|nr:asparaginase domain-containing protein [Saccharospirillum mangrovi]